MQLTDHTDLGLRVLLTLGADERRRWTARELAEAHGLSYTHTQKVVQTLEAAGFIETFRGRGGGAMLVPETRDRSIGDIVRALEPHFDLVQCFRSEGAPCVFEGGCALAGLLRRAQTAFFAELERETLDQVIRATASATVRGTPVSSPSV